MSSTATMTDVKVDRPISRPLSEISENEERRRMSARMSSYSSSLSMKGGVDRISRPASEVLDDPKRVSLSLPVHTITLNLADYAGPSPVAPKSTPAPAAATTALATTTTSTPISGSSTSSLVAAKRKSQPHQPLPAEPIQPAVEGASSSSRDNTANHDAMQDVQEEVVVDLTEEQDGISPLFIAARASLRPTQIAGTDLASSVGSGGASVSTVSPPSTASPSLDLTRSSTESSATKPPVKSKPKWLRRASITPSLRGKGRSPSVTTIDLPAEPTSPHFSTSLPPALPPRKFPPGPMDIGHHVAEASSQQQQQQQQAHPLGDHNASHHSQSLRDVGRRWRATGGVSRSSSNNSIASVASGHHGQQHPTTMHQRFPSSAMLGRAGKAVSSTWNRARGVGSSMSISGMTAPNPVRGMEPTEPVSPGLLTRKLSHDPSILPQEGLVFSDEVVKRKARLGLHGRVFGRDLGQAGRAWGVYDANEEREGEDEYHRRRRQCLPAVVIRCVEYLQTIGREEEGIFRISGRSSHLARLRKEFDAGADLDLTLVDPSDLDPHAIAGTFKGYLRELPDAMIPLHIEHKIEEYLVKKKDNVAELADILHQLPSANWFLLSDVIMLIDLIPKSIEVNRMSHQALLLSLGPTLRLSGEHVQYFVRHRERLFADPPAVSPREMVDFGDEEIPPLSPMYAAYNALPLHHTGPAPPPLPRRPAPKVSKRPSFGNLLASARSSAMRKSHSDQTLLASQNTGPAALSTAGTSAPRLALPENIQSRHQSVYVVETADPDETEELRSSNGGHSPPVKASDLVDDHHYAPGTVAVRARVYSAGTTPIADRFQRSSTAIDSNMAASSVSLSSSESISSSLGHASSHSTTPTQNANETLAAPPNPMVAIRRSPPILFASTVTVMNQEASHVAAANKGLKRKDDAGAERTRESDAGRDSAKRLSAGPGVLDATDEDEAML